MRLGPQSSSEKHDVNVYAQPNVIEEIPANVVWVVVNHDLVTGPKPVTAVVIVGWCNAEIEAAEPEALPAPSPQPEDMAGAKAAPEAPMFPRMIEVVPGIISAGIVSDPLTVPMNVRGVWMSSAVAI